MLQMTSLPPIGASSKRLFLVRHGEVINPGGPDRPVFYGGADVPLSPLGQEEAIAAAEYLKQYKLQQVASSPLSRAMFGAREVAKRQRDGGYDTVVILEGLRELDRGAWYGKTKDEIGLDQLKQFDACDLSVTPEGGESFPQLKERVIQARDEVLAQTHPGRASVIVSHLQVTRCILSEALGIPTEEMTQLGIATASVSCVDYDMDGTAIKDVQVLFQSYKPESGLAESKDGAN